MESIWFYDFSFQPLLIIHDVSSVNWKIMLNDVGSFELHTADREELPAILRAHPYLVAVQGDKQAIITGWQLQEECVVYGRTCNWLLTRRVTPAFETKTDTPDALTREFVSAAFADVPEFVLGEALSLQETISFSLSGDTTSFEAVQSCLEQEHMGHCVQFAPVAKRWIYQSLAGEELELLLSENNRNASNCSYEEDILEYYSGGWYQKEPSESDETTTEAVRTYLAGDAQKTGIYKWDCLLGATTAEEAGRELKKKIQNRKVTAIVRDIKLGRDYHLGDWLQIEVDKGGIRFLETKQVTGVYIWYEAEGSGEEPIMT